jgi:hypothetical protein
MWLKDAVKAGWAFTKKAAKAGYSWLVQCWRSQYPVAYDEELAVRPTRMPQIDGVDDAPLKWEKWE